MEDPLKDRSRGHSHGYGRRQLTWQERLRLAWEMPRLRRRERNERLAILFVLLALIIYVVLAPALNRSTPGSDSSDKAAPAPARRAPPTGPRR